MCTNIHAVPKESRRGHQIPPEPKYKQAVVRAKWVLGIEPPLLLESSHWLLAMELCLSSLPCLSCALSGWLSLELLNKKDQLTLPIYKNAFAVKSYVHLTTVENTARVA